MGTPGWNVQLVGRSWRQHLTFLHNVFALDLVLCRYKCTFAYIFFFWTANSRLTPASLLKRFLLIVVVFFLYLRESQKCKITSPSSISVRLSFVSDWLGSQISLAFNNLKLLSYCEFFLPPYYILHCCYFTWSKHLICSLKHKFS